MKNWPKLNLISFFLFLSFLSCNAKKQKIEKQIKNEIKDSHFQLYSEPKYNIDSLKSDEKRIIIVSTSDLNNRLQIQKEQIIGPDKKKIELEVGGLDTWIQYINIIKKYHPNETLFINGGNTISADDNQSYLIYNDLKKLGFQVFGVGKNELLFEQKPSLLGLKHLAEVSSVPLLASNILDLKTLKPVQFQNLKQHTIITINGVKIGVLNIVDPQIAIEAPGSVMQGYYIAPINKSLMLYAKELKKQGAEIIIAMVNSEIDCSSQIAEKKSLPLNKVNFDPYQAKTCDHKKPLYIALSSLPMNHLDLIIATGNKAKVANFIFNTPVVQSIPDAYHFNVIELVYNTKSKTLVREKTEIHQPTKLCRQFIKKTMDCYTEDPIEDFTLDSAYFWNEPILHSQ